MTILQYPEAEAELRSPCLPVEVFDSSLADLGAILLAEVGTSGGLAVAAPQIGVQASVWAWALSGGRSGVVVNPEIVALSDDLWPYKEGCLSLPDRFWWINRPRVVTIRYRDLDGKAQVWTDDDLAGRMIQHEVDHLNGRLIVDLLSKYERKQLAKELLS